MSYARPSSSLDRVFRLAHILTEATRPLSAAEIAHRSGVDNSTTHRLLQTMIRERYALRDPITKKYVGSPKLLFPLSPYHPWSMVRRDATFSLISLRDKTGFSASLIVFMHGQRILVEFVPGGDPMSPVFTTWVKTPLYASGSGKVLLLSMSARQRRNCLGPGPYPRLTRNTIVDPAQLETELILTSSRGYALSADEQLLGLTTVAAPLFTPTRKIPGCLVLYARSSMLNDKAVMQCAEEVKEAATFLSSWSPALRIIDDLVGSPSNLTNEHSIDVLGDVQWVSRTGLLRESFN